MTCVLWVGADGPWFDPGPFHSLALACLVGLLVLAQAYLFPGMVPAL